MTLKSDVKLEEKTTFGFKNVKNFDSSTQKYQKFAL